MKYFYRVFKFILFLLQLSYFFIRRRLLINVSIPKTKNDQLIILGNGPSLNNDMKDKENYIKDNDSIAVNFFPLSSYFKIFKPKILVLADPVFCSDDIPDYLLDQVNKMADALSRDVDWDFIIYIPYAAKKGVNYFESSMRENNYINLKYYNGYSLDSGNKKINHFFYRKGLLMPTPQNVLVTAIFLGIQMGYPSIKLIGADHSWLNDLTVLSDNMLYLEDKHFDGEDRFRPFYCDTRRTVTFKVHELLKTLSKTFNSYWDLECYAVSQEIKINNCTSKSFIDAFKRDKLC